MVPLTYDAETPGARSPGEESTPSRVQSEGTLSPGYRHGRLLGLEDTALSRRWSLLWMLIDFLGWWTQVTPRGLTAHRQCLCMAGVHLTFNAWRLPGKVAGERALLMAMTLQVSGPSLGRRIRKPQRED